MASLLMNYSLLFMKKRFIVYLVVLSILAVGCSSPTTPSESTPEENGSGNADVLYVKATENADASWTFDVTVSHPDTGWEDYADGWDVVTPDGTILKPDPSISFTRLLLHPHENEQPFTRSQSNIVIPQGVTKVRVRAHDIVDGYGGKEIIVDLKTEQGDGYEVERNR